MFGWEDPGNLSSDSLLSSQSTSLSGGQSSNLLFRSLFNSFFLFSNDQFDVRWRRFVFVNSTVSSEGSSSLLWSLVNLNVRDVQSGSV